MTAALLVAAAGVVLSWSLSSTQEPNDMGMAQVLITDTHIPAGTPAEDLEEFVTLTDLPAEAVTPGALQRLSQVAGQHLITDLQQGEQLLPVRFNY